MKKSLLITLIAVSVMVIFAIGCKKEENANTDTAATDTGVTATSTATTTTGTELSSTATTGTMSATDTSGTGGTMSTMATGGTVTSGTMAPGEKKTEKKAGAPKKKTTKY